MAWAVRQYSKGEIDSAGHKLINLVPGEPARDEALEVINNWRSCHAYPLHVVTKTLKDRATHKVTPHALVARRIKRLSSIAIKLSHNQDMKLSQMQDLGGCRAVLNSVVEVKRLVEVYDEALAKHPSVTDRPFVVKRFDYITNPKEDGYRGIHLIMKYHSPTKTAYNGQRVEIQIRSTLQHSWATAVETCQAFTGQALKSKIKNASESWLRFFALMSSAIAAREKRQLVPGTPELKSDRKREMKGLEKQEQIILMLRGWNAAMQHPTIADDPKCAVFLLELNVSTKRLTLTTYRREEMPKAHALYLEREKETESDPAIQIVLVSADSVANLKRAYPNYYVDTTAFIKAIQQEIY